MITKHDYPDQLEALSYLRQLPACLYATHQQEIHRMVTAILFLPIEKLLSSPYADLLDPSLAHRTEAELTSEFCASIGLSRSIPLRTVGAIGAGGALARIEKSRKVMRENRSEWSQVDELPVSCVSISKISHILSNRLRYHCHLNTGTIRLLHAWFRRSRPLRPTHP
jgi:hypothetical protein